MLPLSSSQQTRKLTHPVGLGDAAQDLLAVVGLLVLDEIEDVLGDFLHRLDELRLVRVAPFDALHEGRKVDVIGDCHGSPLFPASAGRCRAVT